MTIAEANALDRAAFVGVLGRVFEDSPWVSERAWLRRPFHSLDQLHSAMVAEVGAAHVDEQLALLRAHPELGSRTAMTDASTGEQTRAGLGRLAEAERDQLQALNAAYRERFGFPFLYAVKGSTARDIVKALRARLNAGREEEFREALRQVSRIARFRLEDIVHE